MNRILVNMPYQILLEMYENSHGDVELLKTLQNELSYRTDAASLRLTALVQKKIDASVNINSKKNELSDISPNTDKSIFLEVKTPTHKFESKNSNCFEAEQCQECRSPFDKSKFKEPFTFSHCENPNCNRTYLLAKNVKSQVQGYFYENPNKDGIISIDFGTSSVRAAIASHDGQDLKPLKIGAALGAREDFYLASNIFVTDTADPKIYFSMWAEIEKKKNQNNELLYSLSPKSWMTTSAYEQISEPIIESYSVTKEDLLALLLSFAIKGILLEANLSLDALANYEIRISHPVWSRDLWSSKKFTLEKILEKSIVLCSIIEQGLSFRVVEAALKAHKYELNLRTSIDVIEPVAAAIELFRNKPGYRQVCAVIDIGAGTTDLGLFGIVTPDSNNYLNREGVSIKKVFKSLANPISIEMAGDYIDETLTLIYQSKLSSYSQKNELSTFREEIRDRKIELFEDEEIFFDDIKITLSELKNHSRTEKLINEIHDQFLCMLESAKTEIAKQYNLNVNYIRSIDVVFAGGGNKIDFIRHAIPKKLLLDKQTIDIIIRDCDSPSTLNTIDYARLSVCLGGTCHDTQWPSINPKAQTYGALDDKFNKSPITKTV